MKTFGKVLRTTAHWKQDMYQFLRNYRATPHCTTGVTPATALFGRPIRTKLPNPVVVTNGESHDPVAMRQRDAHQKLKIKTQAESRRTIKDCDIQVGDTVLVKQPKRQKLSTPYHPTPLTVTKKHHSMLTAESPTERLHVIRLTSRSFSLKILHSEPVQHLRERQLTLMLRTALLHPFQSQFRSSQIPQWTPVEMLRSWLNLCLEGLHVYPCPQGDSLKRFD